MTLAMERLALQSSNDNAGIVREMEVLKAQLEELRQENFKLREMHIQMDHKLNSLLSKLAVNAKERSISSTEDGNSASSSNQAESNGFEENNDCVANGLHFLPNWVSAAAPDSTQSDPDIDMNLVTNAVSSAFVAYIIDDGETVPSNGLFNDRQNEGLADDDVEFASIAHLIAEPTADAKNEGKSDTNAGAEFEALNYDGATFFNPEGCFQPASGESPDIDRDTFNQQGDAANDFRKRLRERKCQFCKNDKIADADLVCSCSNRSREHLVNPEDGLTDCQSKKYVCQWHGCGAKFQLKMALNQHKKLHNNEKPHGCPNCEKSYSSNRCLNRHIRQTHAVRNVYQCTVPNCLKEFVQRSSLYRHIRQTHEYGKLYRCAVPRCLLEFRQQSSLNRHFRKMHEAKKLYQCAFPSCLKEFTQLGPFNRHKKTHSDIRRFKCPRRGCARVYKWNYDLYRHQRNFHH